MKENKKNKKKENITVEKRYTGIKEPQELKGDKGPQGPCGAPGYTAYSKKYIKVMKKEAKRKEKEQEKRKKMKNKLNEILEWCEQEGYSVNDTEWMVKELEKAIKSQKIKARKVKNLSFFW